jgi:hypothetical protein
MPLQMLEAAIGLPVCIVHDLQISTADSPSCQLHAKTNVGVFTVHEIPLVKSSELLEALASPHHAGTIDPVSGLYRSGHTRG